MELQVLVGLPWGWKHWRCRVHLMLLPYWALWLSSTLHREVLVMCSQDQVHRANGEQWVPGGSLQYVLSLGEDPSLHPDRHQVEKLEVAPSENEHFYMFR